MLRLHANDGAFIYYFLGKNPFHITSLCMCALLCMNIAQRTLLQWSNESIESGKRGVRELAQQLKALAVRPEVLSSYSQQPCAGLQPSVMRSVALFLPAGMHAGRTL